MAGVGPKKKGSLLICSRVILELESKEEILVLFRDLGPKGEFHGPQDSLMGALAGSLRFPTKNFLSYGEKTQAIGSMKQSKISELDFGLVVT